MYSFLKNLVVPSRFDACCLVVALHWLAAIYCVLPISAKSASTQLPVTTLVVLTAAATWVAIVASLTCGKYAFVRTTILLVSSIASILFVLAWYGLGNSTELPLHHFSVRLGEKAIIDWDDFLSDLIKLVLGGLGVAFSVALANVAIRFGSKKLGGHVARIAGCIWRDRTRFLLLLFASLFLIAILLRLTVGDDYEIDHLSRVGFLLSFLLIPVAWLVVFVWFPATVAEPEPGMFLKTASVCLLTVGIAMFPAAMIWFSEPFFFPEMICSTAVGIVFVVAVVGVTQSRPRREQEAAPLRSRPSIFALIPLCLLLCGVAVPISFDSRTLAFTAELELPLAEQLSKARYVTSIRNKSEGRIEVLYSYGYGGRSDLTYLIHFDDSAPDDLLEILEEPADSLMMVSLTPRFDLESLDRINHGDMYATLRDSQLSGTQLQHLLSANYLAIEGDFRLESRTMVSVSEAPDLVTFEQTQTGTVKGFFDVSQCQASIGRLVLYSPVSKVDWPTIEQVAQHCHVTLMEGWTNDFELPASDQSLRQVRVYADNLKFSEEKI